MGSGLSMTSVNKIKELAEQREYSLALDIVDSQDLSKSLNPQFLRVCGEIYINNKRYKDARKILLMAHRLAPEGKRVIYSLTDLYLKMGYKDLAKTYYNLYLYDADLLNPETNQIKYIYGKAEEAPLEELYPLVCPYYIHNLDYDWSFEAFLLLCLMGKKAEADVLGRDYCATFKNTTNSRIVENILSGNDEPDSYFFVYDTKECPDDDPDEEEQRQEERVLLEADELRVNPRDAEITIMVDDYEEVDVGAKHRLKKFLKNENKKENSEETISDDAESGEENAVSDEADKTASEEDQTSKKSLLKKIFSKKKKDSSETDDDIETAEKEENEAAHNDEDEQRDTEADIEADTRADDEGQIVTDNAVEEKDVETGKSDAGEFDDNSNNTEDSKALSDQDIGEEKEVNMYELHTNKHTPIISVDFDNDDFTAEADTVDGLKDEDFSNPFDSISAIKKEKEEPIFVPKRNSGFLFDNVELEFNDDEEEFEVDDFSSNDDEFGSMETEEAAEEEIYEPETEETVEVEVYEPEAEEAAEEEVYEPETEEAAEEDIYEPETEDAAEEEVYEPETEDSVEEEIYEPEAEDAAEEEVYEPETEDSAEEEIYEPEAEDAAGEEVYEPETEDAAEEEVYEPETEDAAEEEVYEPEAEDAAEEEVYEPEAEDAAEEDIYEPEAEDAAEEDIYEPEAEDAAEEDIYEPETEDSVEEEIYEPEAEDSVEEEIYEPEAEEAAEEEIYEPEAEEDIYEPETEEYKDDTRKYSFGDNKKSGIDFPVFRSSLFPNHNKKEKVIQNNFNEIMNQGKDKMQENLQKEEQMQREAEALLASLGIDLSSITVSSGSMDNINTTLYNEPSRDELKASLRIDSVKKNILKSLKEYR